MSIHNKLLLASYRYYDQYSSKQAQSWLQQYASLSGSESAKLEWETQILKDAALSKEVLAFLLYTPFLAHRMLSCSAYLPTIRGYIDDRLKQKTNAND